MTEHTKPSDGGSAFPDYVPDGHYNGSVHEKGMSLRDYFIAYSPIDFNVALCVFGMAGNSSYDLSSDVNRSAFFAVWALAKREMADALLAERAK